MGDVDVDIPKTLRLAAQTFPDGPLTIAEAAALCALADRWPEYEAAARYCQASCDYWEIPAGESSREVMERVTTAKSDYRAAQRARQAKEAARAAE